jgi:hypothetical protein
MHSFVTRLISIMSKLRNASVCAMVDIDARLVDA